MIGKAPGAVVCAHCKTAVGQRDCALCNRTVCEPCRDNWATCDVPHGVEIRLGMGARLRSVDRNGRYGVVSNWRGAYGLVDLHELRTLPYPDQMIATRFTETGTTVTLPYPLVTAAERVVHWTYYHGLACARLFGGPPFVMSGGGLLHELVPDYRDHFVVGSRSDERVTLIDIEHRRATVLAPVEGEVVQTVAVDGTDRLLCTGAYGRVQVDRFEPGRRELERIATLRIDDSDIGWIDVASRRVAVVSFQGGRAALRVFELDGDLVPAPDPIYAYPEVRRVAPPWGGRGTLVAALSPDGRYVAIAEERHGRIEIHDLRTQMMTTIGGHTDYVHLIRFTARTRHIVSADYDNRVLIRPLHEGRFVTQTRKLRLRS